MDRIYTSMLLEQFRDLRQMLFLSGPRQVGKTTLARLLIEKADGYYFNWDQLDDRQQILFGTSTIAERVGLDQLRTDKPLIVFDELHKYTHWKNWLKGFFDYYENKVHILVTGSARMDVFRKGGDSLMGRYFHFRMHPSHPPLVSQYCHITSQRTQTVSMGLVAD